MMAKKHQPMRISAIFLSEDSCNCSCMHGTYFVSMKFHFTNIFKEKISLTSIIII